MSHIMEQSIQKIKKEIEASQEQLAKEEERFLKSKNKKIELENRINSLKKKLKSAKEENGFDISDHAIVQYINRVLDMDLSEIKKEIAGGEMPKDLKDGKYTFYNSEGTKYNLIVKGNVAVTVILA